MSVETDFRAALIAHAPLVALVGTRVVENGAVEGTVLPYVVFSTSHDPILTLAGPVGDQAAIQAECWANGALVADAVADAVVAALAASSAALAAAATVTTRASGFDADQGLDATVLTVEWWQ